jgi:hypothetical protein
MGGHRFQWIDECAACSGPMAQHTAAYRLDHVPAWVEDDEGEEACTVCGSPRWATMDEGVDEPAEHGRRQRHRFWPMCGECRMVTAEGEHLDDFDGSDEDEDEDVPRCTSMTPADALIPFADYLEPDASRTTVPVER